MEQKPEQKIVQQEKDNFRYVVRIGNTDVDGNKAIVRALRKIKGINFMFANAVCVINGINKHKRSGDLSPEEINRISDFIKNPILPSWMLNRRKDPETGENKHLVASDVNFFRDNDIKIMKKIRCYRGIRHIFGLPTRGQKMRSHFRKNKGKVTGVVKSKINAARAEDKSSKEKSKE